jgi:hypothetical protein
MILSGTRRLPLRVITSAALIAGAIALQTLGLQAQQAPGQPTLPPGPMPPTPTTEKPAMSLPAPFYPTGPGQVKQFVVENVYNYEKFTYSPPIVIAPVVRDKASYATPEQTLVAHISAMLAGDYDWWFSNWDQRSQVFMQERNKQANRTPADWRAIWAKTLAGQQIVLTERVETGPFGPYVMLVYVLRDKAGKDTFRSTYVAKLEAGRWVGTQELAEDPLFHYYESGRDRVTNTVR